MEAILIIAVIVLLFQQAKSTAEVVGLAWRQSIRFLKTALLIILLIWIALIAKT